MSKGSYSVYHYDTKKRQTGKAILEDVGITNADQEAEFHARRCATVQETTWKRLTKGENCVFQIKGQQMGFIVMKTNTGTDYETALQSQPKASMK